MRRIMTVWAVAAAVWPALAVAAVSCTLNDPDKDIRRMFPASTSYKTEFFTLKEFGGAAAKAKVEGLLGDRLDDEYEAVDIGHAVYSVFKGTTLLGYVAGETQRGVYGSIQIVLAVNPQGDITDLYFQKLNLPQADRLKADAFRKQFIGLSLTDFYFHRQHYPGTAAGCRMDAIANPLSEDKIEFQNILRGMMKDLILLDMFKLNNAHISEEK